MHLYRKNFEMLLFQELLKQKSLYMLDIRKYSLTMIKMSSKGQASFLSRLVMSFKKELCAIEFEKCTLSIFCEFKLSFFKASS